MKRWLAWTVVGLGLATWACGHSRKNPQQSPGLAEGGCANDCSGSGGLPTGDAAGAPDATAGSVSQGGSFSAQAGGPSSAGAAPDTTIPGMCEPFSTSCSGRNVYSCDVPGTFRRLHQTCGAQQHCEQPSGAVASCVSDLCKPGELRCVGNEVRSCREGGFLEPGDDCGELLCEGNTCQPTLCRPATNFCLDGNVHSCLGQGVKSQLKKTCLFGSRCGEVPGTVACVVLACEPDTSACVDNQVGACAHDGGALRSVTRDCAVQGKVCDANGSCGSLAVDELGGSAQSTVVYQIVNAVDVHSARQLLKLEVSVAPQQSDSNVHWQIYQQPYGELAGFEEVRAEADSLLLAGETTAVTTELSYAFEAGQRYYLGATIDNELGVDAGYELVSEPQLLSFGLVNVPDNVLAVFAMRITTELP